ncbi:MAG TPA: hypothetical protein DCQ97_10325 [Chitinophagaceae bacterium]|nr:hypothetical protein [Chitinophagaceae bacterium]
MTRIILILLFALPAVSMAQVSVRNNGTLYVSNTADTIYINGGFTNASGAAFTNNGMLYVSQDLSNSQSAMAAGTGRLYLNGTGLQTITGSQPFKTYDLVTDNVAGFLVNNNLSVSGVHTYTAGLITTSATPNYMIYEAGSSYSGSSDARHVNGWVKKFGNSNFIFPVGNDTYERPVTLSSLSASGEYNVRYNVNPTPNRTNLNTPLVLVDTFEYWTINRISGGSAQVTMNWDQAKVPFPNVMLSGIRASYYNGSLWTNIGGSATGVVATSGSVTSGSTNIFNTNFVIASVSFVLQAKIITFTADRSNGATRVNYSIGNELNVDRYELEKSDDGISFRTIHTQNANNRNNTEFYSYTDNSALRGTAYYRLKMTELSNRVTYSAIVSVADHSKELYIVRNPVSDRIDLYAGTSATGTYMYRITATNGQVIQTGTLNIGQPGVHSISLPPSMSAGSYVLEMKSNSISLQKLIIKQ